MKSVLVSRGMNWKLHICVGLIVTFGGIPVAADDSAPAAPTGKAAKPTFPKYLGSYNDPLTGYLMTRVTGDKDTPIPNTMVKWEGRTRSTYQTKQVWSADEKLIYLEIGGPLLLDGETYEVLHNWGPPESGTWHPVLPDVMIYVKDNTIYEWNARKNATRSIASFEGYSGFVQSSSADWISADGRLIGVSARRTADGKGVGFLIDLATGKKASPDFVFADHGFAREEPEFQVCRPSLSGKYVVLLARGGDGGENSRGEAFTVFDLDGNEVGQHWSLPHTPGHGDLALTEDGRDVMVGRSDDGWGEKPNYFGSVLWDFETKRLQALGPAGSHTSGRAFRRPGWAFAGNFDEEDSTVFLFALDGSGKAEAICRTWHQRPVNYWAQTQPVPSPTGTRVFFTTNWGIDPKSARNGDCHSFVADFRER